MLAKAIIASYLEGRYDCARELDLSISLSGLDEKIMHQLAGLTKSLDNTLVGRQLAAENLASAAASQPNVDMLKAVRLYKTELNNAKQFGRAVSILSKSTAFGIDDPIVFKLTKPDACPECKRLYLNGPKPRIFMLSDMIGVGDNIGLKKNSRNPVLGSVHPFCRCTVHWLPPGYYFDDNNKLTLEGVG